MPGEKVLLAVDHDDLVPLRRILRDAGFVVVGVSDADSASYILETLEVHLVVAAYPYLSTGGEHFVETLCGPNARRNCRKIALIQDLGRGLAAAASRRGFAAVYSRPIVPTTLLPLIEQVLHAKGESVEGDAHR